MVKETTKCDGDVKEIAATVKRGEGDKTVERLRRQVQESEKLIQQLKLQLQQLEPGQGSGVDNRRRRPSKYPRKQHSSHGSTTSTPAADLGPVIFTGKHI